MNCFRDTLQVPVIVYPPPTVKILNRQVSGMPGTPVSIQTQSSDVTRWRWTPAVGLSCSTCPQPELTINQKISYRVFVTNPGGCTASDEINIVPICSVDDLFVPNTFSPNGDGRNDRFYPMGKGIASIKSLRIFSRWGELVFERSHFAVNDASAGWDGTFKGKALTPDVYVYIMTVLCLNNEVVDMKGNVTLLK
jgi:gliding motility-associated-like protein